MTRRYRRAIRPSSSINTTILTPQNSVPTNDDPKEIKGWEKKTITHLKSLYLDEETSDVDIRVGELTIPVHKVIMKLNSQLLTVGEISHNSVTKKMEVELLPEFTEISDDVSEIFASFYTGQILLSDRNAKAVYKFAKSYDVPLLLKKTYPYLVKTITEEAFPSMLDFSQTVNCSKLMKCCLRKFDNRLSKVLRESDEFLELDYYRIKLLTSSSHIKVHEGKLFKVICKWLDHKPMERATFAKTLLSNIRYDLIGQRSLVNRVYVWIVESQSIDDEARMFLLKAVIAGCKSNDYGVARSYDANRPSSASSTEISSAGENNMPKNSAPTNDEPQEINGWEKKTLANLKSLYLDEKMSDVDIRVGKLIIPAHKIILKLNSQLLTVGDISHNSGTKKMEVELLPEFTELTGVVSEIVESFYTGNILLSDKNAKAVYKFAKGYDVPLLLKKTYPYLVKMITEEGFPSMLDFSQTVNCSKLIKCCLRKFDNRLSKVLRESEEFLELDYYRIKLLTTSSHIKVHEGKLFKVMCKWLDHKPMERGTFAKTLLSNIRYDLIGHRNLVNRVYVWIGESQAIDDEARVFLLKAVITGCKSNDDGRDRSYEAKRPSSASSSETSSD